MLVSNFHVEFGHVTHVTLHPRLGSSIPVLQSISSLSCDGMSWAAYWMLLPVHFFTVSALLQQQWYT